MADVCVRPTIAPRERATVTTLPFVVAHSLSGTGSRWQAGGGGRKGGREGGWEGWRERGKECLGQSVIHCVWGGGRMERCNLRQGQDGEIDRGTKQQLSKRILEVDHFGEKDNPRSIFTSDC